MRDNQSQGCLDSKLARREFNDCAKNISGGNYERRRWFSERGQRENYRVMFDTLNHHLRNISFTRYLEVGCGPGTWTKLLIGRCPDAHFTLLDISPEMIRQAKKALGQRRNITYVIGDFQAANLKGKFDFFFCSRAIEYFPDKALFVRQVARALSPGGKGIIITKNPSLINRKLEALLGRKTPTIHMGKIRSKELVRLLAEAGLKDGTAYPCIINFPPGIKSFKLSRFFWKRFFRNKLTAFSNIVSESYILTFAK